MSANITNIYLLQVPLENDYKHTFYFSSPSTQLQYFMSKQKHNFTTMQKNAFWTSDEGKKWNEKWNERIKTIILLGVLWGFSSFAMLFVAMAFIDKFLLCS